MAICNKCSAEESDSYGHAKCDKCGSLLCVKCTSLTGSEHKAVALKKRSPHIMYICIDCFKPGTSDFGPNGFFSFLRDPLKSLQRQVEEIKSYNVKNDTKLEKVLKTFETTSKSTISKIEDMTTKTANSLKVVESSSDMQITKMQTQLDGMYSNIVSTLQKDKTEYKGDIESYKTELGAMVNSGLDNMVTQMGDKLQALADNIRDSNVELVQVITGPIKHNNPSSSHNTQDLHNQLFISLSQVFNQRLDYIEKEIHILKASPQSAAAARPVSVNGPNAASEPVSRVKLVQNHQPRS